MPVRPPPPPIAPVQTSKNRGWASLPRTPPCRAAPATPPPPPPPLESPPVVAARVVPLAWTAVARCRPTTRAYRRPTVLGRTPPAVSLPPPACSPRQSPARTSSPVPAALTPRPRPPTAPALGPSRFPPTRSCTPTAPAPPAVAAPNRRRFLPPAPPARPLPVRLPTFPPPHPHRRPHPPCVATAPAVAARCSRWMGTPRWRLR